MHRSMRFIQRALAAVIVCFVIATSYISVVIIDKQTAVDRISRYNAASTVGQALAEFLRFERALATFALPSRSNFAEVQLRLDILFSRVATFETAPTGEAPSQRSLSKFVKSSPETEAAVSGLKDRLDRVDSLVRLGPAALDPAEALAILEPLGAEMTALSSRAHTYGAALAAADRDELRRLHYISSALAGGLILCGIVLVLLLMRQNRLLVGAYAHLTAASAELSHTHSALGVQNERFTAALNNMTQALCTCDNDGRLVVYNEQFSHLLGAKNFTQGSSIEEALSECRQNGTPSVLEELYRRQVFLISNNAKDLFTLDLPDGKSFAVAHEPLAGGGWLATYEDVSARRQTEARILYLAQHDALTDLPNRTLLHEWLEDRCRRSHSGDEVAVILLDLDGFKEINDTLGHHIGDEVLKIVSVRLRRCIDWAAGVARLGGDEFAILMPVSASGDDCIALATTILADLSEVYQIEGHEIMLTASIGITRKAVDQRPNPGVLLQQADLAMYQAKAGGKARLVLFTDELELRLHARKALESDLREALDRGEMFVHYQPLITAETLEISGYEALLRWNRGDGGFVSPATFIPIAENMGLIDGLGEWVLNEACREATAWPPSVSVAVNLSSIQFRSGNLGWTVLNALRVSGLSPRRLELEITESVVMDATDATYATLHQLRKMGVRIALDDFGTGYSSLSYLSSFPFDKIKIDRSFVQDLPSRSASVAVVKLIVGLAGELGMTTTAEGVENEDQLACLRAAGCTEVQGFLFAPARPAHEIDASRKVSSGFRVRKATGR